MSLTEKIRQVRERMLEGLVEREQAVRLALLAILSGEHLLLIGPPGTAKSLVARRLHNVVSSGSYFEHLLTRFTVPEELFGPLSIQALENDKYSRQIEHYLPSASIAFLDEIFKANSAILNALLTLLNEREFDNGNERIKTPLLSVVGASNELPEGNELSALYDRFLLRLHVGPISDDGFTDLLKLRGDSQMELGPSLKFTPQELIQIQAESVRVELGDDVVSILQELRRFIKKEEKLVSDRRWRKIVKLLQVSAYSHGRDNVSVWDCWLLQHMTWNAIGERKLVHDWYTEKVGDSSSWEPVRFSKIVSAWEQRLEKDQSEREQIRDSDGNLVYELPSGGTTTKSKGKQPQERNGEPLYIAPDIAKDSRGNDLPNRTNDGRGYTLGELKNLRYNRSYYGSTYRLSEWDGFSEYINKASSRYKKDEDHTPAMQPRSYDPSYIERRQKELDGYIDDVTQWLLKLHTHLEELQGVLTHHLWVDEAFLDPATQSLKTIEGKVTSLEARLRKVKQGFLELPVRDDNIEV